jgi:DNA-directed RNA polymerase subunit RPC12/RpoP
MEQVDQVLDRAFTGQERENTVPCRYCGATVRVEHPGRQWTLRCPACGQKIILTRGYRECRGFVRSEKKRVCPYCDDIGIVEIPRQQDEVMYVFAYRCICQAGQARREKGIPSVAGVDLAPVLRRRMERPLGGV